MRPTVLALITCLMLLPRAAQTQANTFMAGAGLTVERAVSMVERRFQAKVVRATVTGSVSRPVYELKLLSDQGRVWTVRVDAQTGEIR
jgi:uncharacterized membrane protein YkoI